MRNLLQVAAAALAALTLVLSLLPDEPETSPQDTPHASVDARADSGTELAVPVVEAVRAERPDPKLAIQVELLPRIGPPDQPIMAVYDALAERALAGDAVAAYQLYRGLRSCVFSPQTREALDADLEELRTKNEIGGHTAIDPRAQERDLYRDFAFCEGSSDAVDEYYVWLKRAADLGWLRAIYTLGATVDPDWLTEVDPDPVVVAERLENMVEWQRRAIDAGSVEAMVIFALSHHKGRGVPQDAYEAYVYATAAALAYEAAGQTNPSIQRLPDVVSMGLSPWQLEEGRRRALEILADPACCKL